MIYLSDVHMKYKILVLISSSLPEKLPKGGSRCEVAGPFSHSHPGQSIQMSGLRSPGRLEMCLRRSSYTHQVAFPCPCRVSPTSRTPIRISQSRFRFMAEVLENQRHVASKLYKMAVHQFDANGGCCIEPCYVPTA